MRDSWLYVSWLVAFASGLVGKMHASAQRLHATHTSSRMKRAPEVGSTRSARNAMNAPTAAVAPFRTLRRVALPSPAGVVVPLLAIRWCTPPSHSPASDHDALDQDPDEGKTPES